MFSQRSLASFALVLAIIASEGKVVAQNEDIENWRLAWRMSISLDAPKLVPPAVQWTIIDNDLVPGFATRVKKLSVYRKEQLQRADDEAEKEQIRSSQMTVSWDLGFKEVTGDKVYLLVSVPDVFQSIGSNEPGGKKWLVTKIRQIKGKPVCWCIPIEVEAGKELQVTLTEDNMFDLQSAFDEATRQPNQTE